MQLTGADILIKTLLDEKVTTIFGYPGGAVLNIYDALYRHSHQITHILTAHEQGASHAADGYARATGKVGVVLATSGPGATNLVTGIANAYMDSIPMVAITGNVPTDLLGQDSFQEVYIAGITMPITKHNFVVRKVEELESTIKQAFKIAQEGRKGPVLVDIPKDVTAALGEYTPQPPLPLKDNPRLDQAALEKIAQVISTAKKPLVCFGGGIVSGDAQELLIQFLEKYQLPSVHTLMGTGTLSYTHPLNLGLVGMHGNYVGNKAIQESDVLIALGTRFSDRVALSKNKFAKQSIKIHIDIDASEINKSIAVDYKLTAHVHDVLKELLSMVNSPQHQDWLEEIKALQKNNYVPSSQHDRLKPHEILATIHEYLPQDTIIATDVGQHQMWSAQYCQSTSPRNFLTSGGLGTMGFGYGAAIGASVAFPQRRVVHITGDGSFHMNLNEGCTAVSYQLPIITVIMNNSVLGMVRQWQTSFYDKRYSQTDPHRRTDFVKLAEGFGAHGFHAQTLEEFQAVLQQALKINGPVWINCQIDSDEKVLPMIPSGATVESIILN